MCRYDILPGNVQISLYCVPMAPGQSRVYYCLLGDKAKLPKVAKLVIALTPKWLKFANHYIRNEVLDGDNVFLNVQVSIAVTSTLQQQWYTFTEICLLKC